MFEAAYDIPDLHQAESRWKPESRFLPRSEWATHTMNVLRGEDTTFDRNPS